MAYRFFPVKGRGIINERDEVIYDFQGRPIRLPWERWLHIITRKDHLYMVHLREELEETLKGPDLIIQSNVNPESGRVYHKWFEQTVMGSKWVRVVVYFLADDDAFVATAYVDNEVIAGEVLWSREAQ